MNHFHQQLLKQANQLYLQGEYRQALDLYQQILLANPSHVNTLYNCANCLLQTNQPQRAEPIYQNLTRLDPKPDVFLNLAISQINQNKNSNAKQTLQSACNQFSKHPQLNQYLGKLLTKEGKHHQASKHFRTATQQDPQNPDIQNDYAQSLLAQSKTTPAIRILVKAAQLDPKHHPSHYNLAVAYHSIGQYQKAAKLARLATKLDPKHAPSHNQLGQTLLHLDHHQTALKHFTQAIKLDPYLIDAYYNKGLTYLSTQNYTQAQQLFQQALSIESDHAPTLANLIHLQLITTKWGNLTRLFDKIDKITQHQLQTGQKTAENPILNLARHQDPAQNLLVAQSWSRAFNLQSTTTSKPKRGSKSPPKINLAYISSNFRDQATSHLISSLFSHHNRQQFNVYAYSFGLPDQSKYRQQIHRSVDVFRDFQFQSPQQIATAIQKDNIHIAIDLKGLQGEGRFSTFSLRPAPIQITWLGYPATTGADFIDYMIVDPLTVPPHLHKHYAEKIIYLPHSYFVTDNTQPINQNYTDPYFPPDKQSFVFSCFNQAYKFSPEIFHTWINLLNHLPHSYFYFYIPSTVPKNNLSKLLFDHHINPDRVVFGQHLPKPDHLARIQTTDLALDTHHINGHTTTIDTLWAGTPIITLKGHQQASRTTASILTNLGLSELVVNTLGDYQDLALHLATHPQKLNRLRAKLNQHLDHYPIFNTQRFCHNLESVLKTTWKLYSKGSKPQPFHFSDPKPLDSRFN